MRSDSWIHGAIAREIQVHGTSVEDPRFAGVTLNYVLVLQPVHRASMRACGMAACSTT